MKRSRAYVDSRRDQIVALLEQRGKISVSDLADHFQTSPLTIRRDLDILEQQQVLTRQHGYASLLNPLGRPSGSRQVRANSAIAREAARYVKDGDCIFINASSTALSVINYISAQDVTVVTNNGKALLLEDKPNVSVILSGGEIRPPRASLTGEVTMDYIRRVSATKCFLGVTGFSADYGLTSATSPEPAINSLMLERSKYHVVVADSSKIGHTASFQFAAPDDVDLLITDDGATDEQIAPLRLAGMRDVTRVNVLTGAVS